MKHMLQAAVAITFSLAAMPSLAYDFQVDGIYYKILSKTTVAVTHNLQTDNEYDIPAGDAYSGDVWVPATVEYEGTTYIVSEVDDKAFYGCDGLTELIFDIENYPNGIAYIGSGAFYGCNKLREIAFPWSLVHITNDIGLEDTKWYNNQEDGAIYIGSILYTYKGTMSPYTEFVVMDGTAEIAFGAFLGQTGLTSVILPAGLERIEPYAFFLTGLERVLLPDNVSIGEGAFSDCPFLVEIEGYENVTDVELSAFENTPWLETIPDGPWYFGKVLFGYHGTMPENYHLEIKPGTKKIAKKAFYECNNITEVTVPSSVEVFEEDAFWKCFNLQRVNIPSLVDWLDVKQTLGKAWYGSNPMSSGAHVYVNGTEIINLVIPNGYESIPNGAFAGACFMESITLPSSLKEVGEHAFYATRRVTKVYCRATTPPILHGSSMRGLEWSNNSELYVPEESVDLYKNNTQGWETWVIKSINTPRPTITLVDGELHFESEVKDVTYKYSFQMIGETSGSGETKTGVVPISNRLKVTVQATSPGLDPSAMVEKEILIDPYDVDGNGVTNVTDVTRIIDKIVKNAK